MIRSNAAGNARVELHSGFDAYGEPSLIVRPRSWNYHLCFWLEPVICDPGDCGDPGDRRNIFQDSGAHRLTASQRGDELACGGRAESGEPIQIRDLIQIETEQVGGGLILHRFVDQISQARNTLPDEHFRE